jgi:hypothetical protein
VLKRLPTTRALSFQIQKPKPRTNMKLHIPVFTLSTMIWTASGQQGACSSNTMHDVANGVCEEMIEMGCEDAPTTELLLENCAALKDLYFQMTEGGGERRSLRTPRQLAPKDTSICDHFSRQAKGNCKAYCNLFKMLMLFTVAVRLGL